jgi:hypothetical protein
MNAFNRGFAVTIGLLWIAAWAGALYLMWTPDREMAADNQYIQAAFDLSVSGSDRILGTVIAVMAMVPGAVLMAAQALPSRPARARGAWDPAGDDGRFHELRQRLDDLQRRVDDRPAFERSVVVAEPLFSSERGYARPQARRWTLFGREHRQA